MKKVLGGLLLVLLVSLMAAGGLADVFFDEVAFAKVGENIYLTGLVEGAPKGSGVVVYLPLSFGLSMPYDENDPDRYIYPLDEQGRFSLVVPILVGNEDNRVGNTYELYAVMDGKFMPENNYDAVKAAAIAQYVFDTLGWDYDQLQADALAYAQHMGFVPPAPGAGDAPAQAPGVTAPAEEPSGMPTEDTQALPAAQSQLPGQVGDLAQAALDRSLDQPLSDRLFIALGDWVGTHALATGEQGNGMVFAWPDFSAFKFSSLPDYGGEEPGNYLDTLVNVLATAIEGLPVGGTLNVAMPTSDGDQAMEQLVQAAKDHIIPAYSAWAAEAFESTKAYQAMTCMALPLPEGVKWESRQFAQGNAKPGKAAASRKALKRGASGAAVKKAQEALIALGLLETKADGKFGKSMEAAVEAFQMQHGLPVDGVLEEADFALLYGEAPPVSLMDALGDAGVDGDYLATWWPLLIAQAQDIAWSGLGGTQVLTFTLPQTQGMDETAYDGLIHRYLAGGFAADTVPCTVKALVTDKTTRVTVSIPLAVGDGLPAQTIGGIHETLAALGDPMESLRESVQDYADTHLPPIPLPKNGVLLKPGSGSSKFIIDNGGANVLYVKIYRVQGEWDDSTDQLVATAMVHGYSRVSVKIQPGYYHVHYGTGDTWYGEAMMFGDEGYYQSAEGSYQFRKNYEHTLSISISDAQGDAAQFDPISGAGM